MPINTTDGITTDGTTKFTYRDWEVTPLNLYYKHKLVLTVIHNVVLVSDSVKFLIPTLIRIHKEFFVLESYFVENSDAYFLGLTKRFENAAYNGYFIPSIWFRILKKSDYRYQDKFLNHCLTLNYSQFTSAANKHRSRQVKDKKVLSGLWYQNA